MPLPGTRGSIEIVGEDPELEIVVWVLNTLDLRHLFRTQSGTVKQVGVHTDLELMGDTQVLDKK